MRAPGLGLSKTGNNLRCYLLFERNGTSRCNTASSLIAHHLSGGQPVRCDRRRRSGWHGASAARAVCGWRTHATTRKEPSLIVISRACARSGAALLGQIERDTVGGPGGHARAEEIGVLGPDGTTKHHGAGEHRRVIGVAGADAAQLRDRGSGLKALKAGPRRAVF